jgi:hypothetical protein
LTLRVASQQLIPPVVLRRSPKQIYKESIHFAALRLAAPGLRLALVNKGNARFNV